MPATTRTIADDLADHAHALLAGAEPHSIIEHLEYTIQDLQELADNANTSPPATAHPQQTHSL